ncbi:MAG: peptidylprolyl isomerase, partial [Chloroflexi bacterium]|nr:peptidylprolyl isomerase [Chloroflexota bacterium]
GPNTNGSQFFIMHGAVSLPKRYTIFGRVTEGLDVLDSIANTPVTAGPGGEVSRPTQDVVIRSIEIKELAPGG